MIWHAVREAIRAQRQQNNIMLHTRRMMELQ